MKTNIIRYLFIFLIVMGFNGIKLVSQVTGGPEESFPDDSTITFDSPRPMLTYEELNKAKDMGWGADLIFSTSGFGGGAFIRNYVNDELILSGRFFISGARNSDEFEVFDPIRNEFRVQNKVNRLFSIPFLFSAKYFPLNDVIVDTFRPYIGGGAGFSFIISTPYSQDFFSAFGDGVYYTRPAFEFALGAEFGKKESTISSFGIKYYVIPFGGEGLESLDSEKTAVPPITDFGGFFLTLSVGLNY